MDMNNYRGISLMPVLLKLVSAIIAVRISTALEEDGLISNAQAGFRTNQRCVGQVAALLEILG